MLTEKLSEKSSTQARTPGLEMPVEAEAWIMWGSWAGLGSVMELGSGPRLLTVKETSPELNKLELGVSPIF